MYRFARAADDIADEGDARRPSGTPRSARSARARRDRGGERRPSPFPRWPRRCARMRCRSHPFRDLFSAFAQDIDVARYPTYADARRLLPPLGESGRAPSARALRDRRRAKPPRKRCDLHGAATREFLAGRRSRLAQGSRLHPARRPRALRRGRGANRRWRAQPALGGLMAFETARTRVLFATGRPLARRLPLRAGIELRAVIAGGSRILERIDAVGGDVFTRRPTLTRRDWALLACRALWRRHARAPANDARSILRQQGGAKRLQLPLQLSAARSCAPRRDHGALCVLPRSRRRRRRSHRRRRRARQLAWWRTEIDAIFSGAPHHPVALALVPVVRRHALQQAHLQTVIDGMQMDLDQVRYLDFAELEAYCDRVAGVVGLMSAEIFGYEDPATRDYARDLGIAFQLTNIIRDVGEDARRGRIYLPQDELARFGVTSSDVLRGHGSAALRRADGVSGRPRARWYDRALAKLPARDRRAQRAGLRWRRSIGRCSTKSRATAIACSIAGSRSRRCASCGSRHARPGARDRRHRRWLGGLRRCGRARAPGYRVELHEAAPRARRPRARGYRATACRSTTASTCCSAPMPIRSTRGDRARQARLNRRGSGAARDPAVRADQANALSLRARNLPAPLGLLAGAAGRGRLSWRERVATIALVRACSGARAFARPTTRPLRSCCRVAGARAGRPLDAALPRRAEHAAAARVRAGVPERAARIVGGAATGATEMLAPRQRPRRGDSRACGAMAGRARACRPNVVADADRRHRRRRTRHRFDAACRAPTRSIVAVGPHQLAAAFEPALRVRDGRIAAAVRDVAAIRVGTDHDRLSRLRRGRCGAVRTRTARRQPGQWCSIGATSSRARRLRRRLPTCAPAIRRDQRARTARIAAIIPRWWRRSMRNCAGRIGACRRSAGRR